MFQLTVVVFRSIFTAVVITLLLANLLAAGEVPTVLSHYLPKVTPGDILPGAEAFGPIREDLPVAPILAGGKTVGWVFATSDFVGTIGYSGKPIHVLVGISPDAVLSGAKLVQHSEPIVLVGIPESRIRRMISGYVGTDIRAEITKSGSAHELDIISGATVTVMVIEDSVLRSSVKVARALGLGGIAPELARSGPKYVINNERKDISTWNELAGSGAIKRFSLDIRQINAAFAATGDVSAIARPEQGAPSETYIDLALALVSVPSIGLSLLGEAEYRNLQNWLADGQQAILIAGRGRYSFKGSGYVRGGIFDRITVVQDDATVRFHDRQQRRLGDIAALGAPSFTEVSLFKIPAGLEFDPTEPWRLQLLVQRAVGALDKRYLTYDLNYRIPQQFLNRLTPEQPATISFDDEEEAAAKAALWKRIWLERKPQIAALLVMLTVLTGVFFFQKQATRNARALFWFRMGFLSITLVFLGWYANAQLSVVNLIALAGSLRTGFSWDAFLLDPLIFILWSSVAVALIFWGRGAYCGWLCPFGALQELTNRIARAFRVPQIKLPWGLHERLWPVKYLIFLGLFGLSFASIPLAEQYSEVEPFKTAIILKFQRGWPYIMYVLVLLGIGLFIERFFCRYLCPLGAALAIPARLRMFAWLKRYRDCGNPCQTCAIECPVEAIHPTGEINPNECINCLHCQVLYQSADKCPVIIKQQRRRARDRAANQSGNAVMQTVLAGQHGEKETRNV
ncbi:MAG: 4Fe-4S binding protein [Halocynthiibacter sp.]